ncbi:hypothetical protein ACO9S2_00035 [Nitrospira sp. NS4]|uniref:hypothetical protein n=1 Tax=Nitrospira sp. NS4 TaxID=3414498 RepID=UPI003C30C4EF
MKPILPICCICEKARDDEGTGAGEGLWQEMKPDMVLRGLRTQTTIFAYGCCPDCLTDDPQASAFRARGSQSGSSICDNRELSR